MKYVLPPKGTVSHHFLRRTARKRRDELRERWPSNRFKVVSYKRGPFGFRVERTV